jgi:hypothetical protein
MKSAAELEQELLRLPPAERARLALRVWESLANDPKATADPVLDPEGLSIARERDAELNSGSVETIDDGEFRRRCGVMDED